MGVRPHLTLTLSAGLAAAALVPASLAGARTPRTPRMLSEGGLLAVRAGTIHLVDGDRVLHDGTLLIRDGRIVEVGEDLQLPVDAQVVDYGPDAVIVPGLVAPFSTYALGNPSDRTAAPGLDALDGFDFHSDRYGIVLGSGVTSMYVTPAEGRLIAGTGAVVKLAGEDVAHRTLGARVAIHAAIDESARHAPGFWEPPVPATVDVGMGYYRPQLPATTMGAIVALHEILAAARQGDRESEYGPYLPRDLAPLLEAGVPWRISARTDAELRAALELAAEEQLPLILDRADEAGPLADDIAAAGAGVVFRVPFDANGRLDDLGKGRDDRWPRYDVPAELARAGVRFAIASAQPHDLLFAAGLASRGGLDPAAALRAITLGPAELLGVDGRVGSLVPGKDADFAVLDDAPISGRTAVLATWIDGALAWQSPREDDAPVVVRVEELHVGDGRVLRPGEVLLAGGRIREVAERVSVPRGARVVTGRAAMPGIVDALGHLGLEGSSKVPSADFPMSSILEPGDRVDRRVARSGVTTVVLSPRGAGRDGAPVAAYKPAAEGWDGQLVEGSAAVRVSWAERNRLSSGAAVKDLLTKAAEYRQKWAEYEKEMREWKPPAEKAERKDDEEAKDEGAAEEGEGEDKADEDEDEDKKPSKKKKGEEELAPDPITGVWEASVERPPRTEAAPLKTRLHLVPGEGSGRVEGNLRCEALSDSLIELDGYWSREEKQLELEGLGSTGWLEAILTLGEGQLKGTLSVAGESIAVEAKQTSTEWVVAKRPERRMEKAPEEPKGKPREPKRDQKLEPVVAVLEGRAALVVEVDRADEIVDCVRVCRRFGVRPVLYGASDAHLVIDEIAGRVAGVLLEPQVLRVDVRKGLEPRTPWADLQNAGIPVAFHSDAEEGAAELLTAALYAVSQGMSPTGALRALTSDAARMMGIDDRVGRLEAGLDGDLLLLDGPPLGPATSVVRAFVNGKEVHE